MVKPTEQILTRNTYNLPKKILKILSNLKFAIVILLLIALTSIVGTIIEQNQTLDFYKENYPDNILLFFIFGKKVLVDGWKIIKFFDFDNVYKSWWYLTLIIILGSSLIACTFSQCDLYQVN